MIIRELQIADSERMLEWMHDEDVVRDLDGQFRTKTLDDCILFIKNSQNDLINKHWAICNDENIYLGTVSLKNIDFYSHSAEFAIVIRKDAMGSGAAKCGMDFVCKKAFSDLELDSIYWYVSPKNLRANRFYEKNGYKKINIKDQPYCPSNIETDNYIWYSIERLQPLVSILIPIYCHEKFLQDLIDSLIDQTYKNIEIIMCDDCSTDGSYLLAEKNIPVLKECFNRVLLLKNDVNQGITRTLNKLIKNSLGDYIKVIASDDILSESAISIYVEQITSHRGNDLLWSNAIFFDEELSRDDLKKQLAMAELAYPASALNEYGNDWLKELFKGYNLCSPTLFFSRKLIEKIGWYDEDSYIEDYDFAFKAAKEGIIPIYIPQPLVFYRLSSNSISHSESDLQKIKMIDAELRTLEKYKNLVDDFYFHSCIICKFKMTMDTAGQKGNKAVRDYLLNESSKFNISKQLLAYYWYLAQVKKHIKRIINYKYE